MRHFAFIILLVATVSAGAATNDMAVATPTDARSIMEAFQTRAAI